MYPNATLMYPYPDSQVCISLHIVSLYTDWSFSQAWWTPSCGISARTRRRRMRCSQLTSPTDGCHSTYSYVHIISFMTLDGRSKLIVLYFRIAVVFGTCVFRSISISYTFVSPSTKLFENPALNEYMFQTLLMVDTSTSKSQPPFSSPSVKL